MQRGRFAEVREREREREFKQETGKRSYIQQDGSRNNENESEMFITVRHASRIRSVAHAFNRGTTLDHLDSRSFSLTKVVLGPWPRAP